MPDLPPTSEVLYEQAAADWEQAGKDCEAMLAARKAAELALSWAEERFAAATRALAVHEVSPGVARWRQEAACKVGDGG